MNQTSAEGNAAYRRGLCKTGCGRPYAAGMTRCSECHLTRHDEKGTA